MTATHLKKFHKFTRLSIYSLFLLILLGGTVRSTGSGLGCPDWPQCFGSWIPPTSIEQISDAYQKKYPNFSEQFNPVKTWLEYINRLAGVVVGIVFLSTFFIGLSISKKSKNSSYALSSGVSLSIVIIQGGIGAIVVKTHLLPNVVTVHMLLALVVMVVCAYSYHISDPYQKNYELPPLTRRLLIIFGILTVSQIIIGTQIREVIDTFINNSILAPSSVIDRNLWIPRHAPLFIVHRSLSWLFLIFILYLGYIASKMLQSREKIPNHFLKQLVFIFSLIMLSIVSGIQMNYGSIPAYIQPLHLLSSSILTYVFSLTIFRSFKTN